MSKGAKTGGRQKGTPNKLTGQNRETLTQLAQRYEAEAIELLAELMRSPKVSPAARATCINSMLDRARGKPAQFQTDDPAKFRQAMEMSDDELATIAARGRNGAAEEAPHSTVLQ